MHPTQLLPPLRLRPCAAGGCLPLAMAASPSIGTTLCEPTANAAPLLKVTGYAWLPDETGQHTVRRPLLTALRDIAPPLTDAEITLEAQKHGRSLAWITLSDKGSLGLREDKSGPAIAELVAGTVPLCHSRGYLLPDDAGLLRALLTDLALNQGYDIICTTGGTGLSPRDITPQVTSALLDMPLPGFVQAMLAASLAKTPHAAISRAAAGVLGQSIILNLPGSRKAVLENLAAVLPALPHALDKLHGDPADCGG
ncbi:MAG: MogA/MoaB family molybdenum cofactor biosynthesis protein [Desulfovibrio sp.]|nr:MogA/MoaB family molybdenum cofactor biosynthesis protein [Desulfovibrio sp.]